MHNSDVIIGEREVWGAHVPFSLSPADRRQHVYLVGKTGTGKSTLLKSLILRDIAAGRAVGLIDPHGDLAANVLSAIPKHRTDHLVYFDPADAAFPVALNPLFDVPPGQRHLVASGIVSALKGVWRESWGARMEYILYAGVAALLDCQNVTLLGLPRMLIDAPYREWVVKQVKDPLVRAFWTKEYERYDKRFMQEAIAPIQNKVGRLLMSAPLRNVLGQVKRRVDARFMMDHGRIFLANLAKGRLGEDKTNLLGSLLVSQFQLAALSRADTPEHERRDFHLYIDEFGSFTTDAFASILSEARKYRLCLTLAHQYMAQLQDEVRDAVLGNCGTLVSFRVGNEDGDVLAATFGNGLAAEQFSDLGNYHVIVKLLQDGQLVAPFRGRTLAPVFQPTGRGERLIRLCRQKYARDRVSVEDKINRWLTLYD